MMRLAIVLEIEQLLFDTQQLRARALHSALAHEGVRVQLEVVSRAHDGITASMALSRIPAAQSLDGTGRELTLRRAADQGEHEMTAATPAFDPAARDALLTLAAEYSIGVVTRANIREAEHLLNAAELTDYIRTIRSVAETDAAVQHLAWSGVIARMQAEHAVAIVPLALQATAARAGIRTIVITPNVVQITGVQFASLADVHASFINTIVAQR
jgi:phosphoglycolate phosphatase-like HAD superfamily hydrolase